MLEGKFKYKPAFLLVALMLTVFSSIANFTHINKIVVSKDGKGDFKTIQGAINSLPDSSSTPRYIFIKNGVYAEKIYIEKNNIVFEGQDREATIIIASIARDEWRCNHADDWGVATMNIGASDITLKNLTVTNNFGFEFTARSIYCASDTSSNKLKELRKEGHQMALRTIAGATRLSAINCHFRAYGGDTVSPWDVENGYWYFRDCIMEGGVDFYCPRGWAWAENCEFITLTGPAAIWHDGSKNPDSKTILKNCRFNGYDGFMLGRYHRDAQFFLLDCVFSQKMSNKPIYLVPTNNKILWGNRIYFYNCHRENGNDFSWHADLLPEKIKSADITVEWLFNGKWNPHSN